ncbi:hypothetical protein HZS_2221 [Henneguya salminicola]|nr:hypothetical protein HZS_2221 [Henneguya salminicola]
MSEKMVEGVQLIDKITQKLKFRNYNPNDEIFNKYILPSTKPVNIKERVEEFIQKSKTFSILKTELVSVINKYLGYKRVGAKKTRLVFLNNKIRDYKRYIETKLNKLHKKTQESIVDLIYEKTKEEKSAILENPFEEQDI